MGKFFNKEAQVAKGVAIGSALGAVAGSATGEKSKKKSAVKGAIVGGLLGASVGFAGKAGKVRGTFEGQRRQQSYSRSQGPYRGNVDNDLSVIGIDKTRKKTITKKKEVKKMHRKAAFKNHPDKGGDPAKMSEINNS